MGKDRAKLDGSDILEAVDEAMDEAYETVEEALGYLATALAALNVARAALVEGHKRGLI